MQIPSTYLRAGIAQYILMERLPTYVPRALASTSVRMNTWSMLWQSMWTHTPMISSLCDCTLPLSFQNYIVSPLIHASHVHLCDIILFGQLHTAFLNIAIPV